MKYFRIRQALFLKRPNRFIACVSVDGQETVVHVKNTGRCRELLVSGCTVYLEESSNPARKTKYDLIAVRKGNLLINMDSQAPNDAAEEWLGKSSLFPPYAKIRREVTHGKSRFDFCAEYDGRTCFLEVKGVTLEDNGTVRFPDAPTERGVKHVQELIQCVKEGYDAVILFVIQMKGVKAFMPNDAAHPEFGKVLRLAKEEGVRILAMDCIVTPESMTIDCPVPADF